MLFVRHVFGIKNEGWEIFETYGGVRTYLGDKRQGNVMRLNEAETLHNRK